MTARPGWCAIKAPGPSSTSASCGHCSPPRWRPTPRSAACPGAEKLRRGQWIEDGLLNHLPDSVTAAHRTRLAAALTPLFGSDAVVWTQDAAELDREQSLDVMAWIARTVVEATIRDP